MKNLFLLVFTGLCMTLSGCQLLGPDSDDDSKSTYPSAMDLMPASFVQIVDGTHEVGEFNLTAFVVGISECPEDHACLIADHIQVAENPHTDGIPLLIDAFKPSQFEVEAEYVFSVEIIGGGFPETPQSLYVRLLGYSVTN